MRHNDVPVTIATLIASRRKALGQTNDKELAGLTGRDPTTVSRWRRGTGFPDLAEVPVLANWLDKPEDEVMAQLLLDRAAAGLRRPRVPVVDVPGTAGEVDARYADLERRVSVLEHRLGPREPPPGRAAARRGSKK